EINTNEDYTNALLCHAQIYAFADIYDIPPLRSLALHKLKQLLIDQHQRQQRPPGIFDLIKFGYANTTGRNNLRSLISEYAACVIEDLSAIEGFRDLLEEAESFAADLVSLLVDRLS
ncbi:MAG: hypothetical protein MMC23_009860, partial [Stictis urceolatum]|nr:hypothetical protein [Stictis urceolata]